MTDPRHKASCYHCGEDCGPHPVMSGDKPFCCNGCRTVYEILSRSDACDYYDLNQAPGTRVLNRETGERYAYLDSEEIKNELLLFSDGGISTVRFYIPAIHCSSCIWLLENLNRLNPGILQSHVVFSQKEVTITYRESAVTLRQVVELLASVNYLPEISQDNVRRKTRRKGDAGLLYRLGVAGFCFGNIMLFSFPEYLASGEALETFIRDYLRWLNLFFSLPVMFYSGSVYLVSAYKGLRRGFIPIDVPVALGMVALFTRSAWEIVSGAGPGFMDSLSGLVFFLLVGKWYQGKTYEALSFDRDYLSYFPVSATVIDDEGREHTVPIRKLKAGNRLLIRNGELIPADAWLVEGEAHIDYSFVSGESAPVLKRRGDRLFAGGRQIGGALEVIVDREVDQSYLTSLWNRRDHEKSAGAGISGLMDRLSRRFTAAVLVISALTGLTWLLTDPALALNAFTSVLIVACPCALALTLPFAFGNTMRIFGKNGFYLKQSGVVETLAAVNVIVFDKTGTITENDRFGVDLSHLCLEHGELPRVVSLFRQSTHPVSAAIYRHFADLPGLPVTDFSEATGSGISGLVEGHRIKAGSEHFVTGDRSPEEPDATRVYVSAGGTARGYIKLSNSYRPGLGEVLGDLGRDYSLHLLSGDNASEKPILLPLFGEADRLHFFQSPHDKLGYIRRLRTEGHKVLMIGDGLNDAGALQASNAGISVADEVYHFSPACDGILDSGKFARLPAMLRFTHTSLRIVRASIVISLLYNLAGISIAASGLLEPVVAAILMPASSVSVVAFVTLTTTLLARKKGLR